MRQAGKGVILEVASQDLKKKIEKILKAEQVARTSVSTYRLIFYSVSILIFDQKKEFGRNLIFSMNSSHILCVQ